MANSAIVLSSLRQPRLANAFQGSSRSLHTTSGINQLLTVDNINQNIRRLEYAVRGPLVIRAAKLDDELKSGAKKPFKNVIRANIGT